MRAEDQGSAFRMTADGDMSEMPSPEEAEPSRRQVRGILAFIACLLLGLAFGCSTGVLILVDARANGPVPHGGMYAALGAWLIFVPVGTIAGAIVGLIVGIWIGKRPRTQLPF
jgi:ABC-type phosphate transport system permease subunit